MLESYKDKVPQVSPRAFVHAGAWVIGDVHIGDDASVWPTAVLRGDVGPIYIGARSNIQDGTIGHDTTDFSELWVGEEVTVGHRVVLHGCRIEDRCLIGMGAIVLDNAVIGTGSLVGAGAVVTVGTQVPPGSIVLGSPARVVGQVTDKHRKMIDLGWRTYVQEAAHWRSRSGTQSA